MNEKINDIPFFFCRSCKRYFTQATNSYFAGFGYLSSFGNFAKLRLAGHSQEQISDKLEFALTTVRDRDRLFLKIMKNEYPTPYAWWKPHQDYQDKRFTPAIEQEQDFLLTG